MSDTLVLAAPILAFAAALVAGVLFIAERRARSVGRRAQSRFSALMDATGFGVLIVDADGRISYANVNAVDTLGYPASQLLGQNKHQLLHSQALDEKDAVCPLQEALREHKRYIGHDHFVDMRGNLVPIAVSAAPLSGDSGGAVILFRDRSTEVAEARQRESAFALISHELRSPLTTIVGFSQRLHRAVEEQRLSVDDHYAEEIALLAREAARMRDIVTVILDVATMERRIDVEVEPIMLARLAEEEADRVLREHPEVKLEVSGSHDIIVESDDRYVRRVVHNLIENAVKYGGADQPIEITVVERDQGAAITVRDHGPGIPRDVQARVFERFFRQRLAEGQRPGLGLGLFLARRLADRLGGRLTLESELGQGAAFTLWLPDEFLEVEPPARSHPAKSITWDEQTLAEAASPRSVLTRN